MNAQTLWEISHTVWDLSHPWIRMVMSDRPFPKRNNKGFAVNKSGISRKARNFTGSLLGSHDLFKTSLIDPFIAVTPNQSPLTQLRPRYLFLRFDLGVAYRYGHDMISPWMMTDTNMF
jgi:hypothetical protein